MFKSEAFFSFEPGFSPAIKNSVLLETELETFAPTLINSSFSWLLAMLLNEPVITIDLELKGLSPLISTSLGLTPKVIKSSS